MENEKLPSEAHVQSDGWVSLPGPDEKTGVHMRLQPDETGRLVVTSLFLDSPRITAALLRKIQPARVEAMVNLAADKRRDVDVQGGGISSEDPDFASVLLADALTTFTTSDEKVTLGELRQRKPVQLSPPRADREPLGRPDGKDAEGFYRRVAEAYRELAEHTRAPAVRIAEEANVPLTTAHRWIREARRRGFLPPAQKGKAG